MRCRPNFFGWGKLARTESPNAALISLALAKVAGTLAGTLYLYE